MFDSLNQMITEVFPGTAISMIFPIIHDPPNWPELKPLDIFLRGYLKSIVYTDPAPETIQQLKDRIISAIQDIPVIM